MKRGSIDHPKMKRLAKLLKIRQFAAVGIVEMLIHFTAEYAPTGDIGRFTDDEISDACDWFRKPSELIAALVRSGFVDADPARTGASANCRLIVHDWSQHADDGVDAKLFRGGRAFADGKLPTGKRLMTKERMAILERRGHDGGTTGARNASDGIGPCPPLPSPALPCLKPPIVPQGGRKENSYCQLFEDWWSAYPRKENKRAAYKAWSKAGASIKADRKRNLDSKAAAAWLLERVTAYAASPRALESDPEKIPLPTTWLNGGRYDDDPQTWRMPLTDRKKQPAAELPFDPLPDLTNYGKKK